MKKHEDHQLRLGQWGGKEGVPPKNLFRGGGLKNTKKFKITET